MGAPQHFSGTVLNTDPEQREPCRAGRSCPGREGTLLSPEREEKGACSKKGAALQGNLNSLVVKTGTHPSSTGAKLPGRQTQQTQHSKHSSQTLPRQAAFLTQNPRAAALRHLPHARGELRHVVTQGHVQTNTRDSNCTSTSLIPKLVFQHPNVYAAQRGGTGNPVLLVFPPDMGRTGPAK